MPRTDAVFTGSLGVDHEGGDLVLTGWDHTDDAPAPVRVVVPAEHVLAFIRDVASHGTFALGDSVRAIAAGDCGVCGNSGLVDAVSHGRLTNAGCTACTRQQMRAETALADRPRWRQPDLPDTPEIAAAREESARQDALRREQMAARNAPAKSRKR